MPDDKNAATLMAGRTDGQSDDEPVVTPSAGTDLPKGGAPAPDAVRKDKVAATPDEREAGRDATAPHEIPLKGWKNVIKRAGAGFLQDRIMAEAASITFYVLLALFPAIAALISVYGLFTNPAQIGNELASLSGVIPGDGMQIIQSQITALTAKGHGTLGFAAIISLAVSLWSANNGIKSLIGGSNVVYHEHEKRSYVRLTLVSLRLHGRHHYFRDRRTVRRRPDPDPAEFPRSRFRHRRPDQPAPLTGNVRGGRGRPGRHLFAMAPAATGHAGNGAAGAALPRHFSGSRSRCCFPSTSPISPITTKPMALWVR
jgi:hypothetical protein